VVSETALPKADLTLQRLPDATLTVRLSGDWKLGRQLPQGGEFRRRIESAGVVRRITFETQAVTGWYSGLITFLLNIIEIGSAIHIPVDMDGLPAGVQRILALASAIPERIGVRREAARASFIDRVGDSAIACWGLLSKCLPSSGRPLSP
jgi:phospholipid/cholesterol/gamma-HCH transport system permease protein